MRPSTRTVFAAVSAALVLLVAVGLPTASAAREQESVTIRVENSVDGGAASERTMSVEEKNSWPELVGRPVAEAKAAIEREAPGLKVIVVATGSMVTMDYNLSRVWLWEEEGKVAQVPARG